MMDGFDFEEMLKKQLESVNEENKKGKTVEDGEHNAEGIMKIIENGSMVKLAKASTDRMHDCIKKLMKDLSNIDESNPATFNAIAHMKIKNAAKEMEILDTIISSSAIAIGASMNGDEMSETLDLILKIGKI